MIPPVDIRLLPLENGTFRPISQAVVNADASKLRLSLNVIVCQLPVYFLYYKIYRSTLSLSSRA